MMENLRMLVPLAWRNIWRNPRRTLITLIVVSVGVWSLIAFSSFMSAWGQSGRDATLRLLLGQGQIHAAGYLDDPDINHLMPPPDARLRAALDGAGIGGWVMRLQLPAVVQSEYKTLPVTFLGVDPAAERKVSVLPDKVVEGRYLQGPADDGIVIGLDLAKRLKTELGRRVIVMSTGSDGWLAERSFDIVGLYDADKGFEDTYIFTGRDVAQDMVGVGDRIAQIAFVVPQEKDLDGVITRLKAAAPDLDVRPWRQMSLMLAAMDSTMGGVIFIWLGVMMVLVSIGVINTQLMAVFERTAEFGLLQALGMRAKTVLGLATVLGLSGGIDLSRFSKALEAFRFGNVIYMKVQPMDYVIYPLAVWGMGVLVALWPAWRAQRVSPVEAMRHET